MGHPDEITAFIAHWRSTGGSEHAITQSFINGLCDLLGVPQPHGSKADDAGNDSVFERRVFQDNGDGTQSFRRVDCYKPDSFILEAKGAATRIGWQPIVGMMTSTFSARPPPPA